MLTRSVQRSTGRERWLLTKGTLLDDGGDRYAGTYYNDAWVDDQGLELGPYTDALETFLAFGAFAVPAPGDVAS